MAKQTFTTGQVLTAAQMTSLQQTAMLGGAASAKTASYTLVAADAGTAISMNSASATTITVDTALFAAGDTVQITNLGAGVCTITPGTATVNTSASLALAQYESGTLDFTSTSAAIFIKGAGAAASSAAASASATVDTSETTSSTSFTDLTTAGPAVTLTTGTKALVIIGSYQSVNNLRIAFMGFAVSGATTLAASSTTSYFVENLAQYGSPNLQIMANRAIRVTGLTAGSNTFTAKYAVNTASGGTVGLYANRNIFVMDLGS
jgi:hypothetical protein